MGETALALQKRREEVIGRLSHAFESEELTDEEFEKRLDKAHRAGELEVLRSLVGDLAAVELPATLPAVVPAQPIERLKKRKAVAIFGSTERHGQWTPGAEQRAVAVFGSVVLDFTEAHLPPGVTEVEVKVVFGNVEIYVPPHLEVECEGMAVFGNFETVERTSSRPEAQAPRLRIKGSAFFGNVEVITRVPGQKKRGQRQIGHE